MTAPAPRRRFDMAEPALPPDPPAAMELLSALWRRRFTVLACALAALFVAGVGLSLAPERYVAQAEVLLEARAPQIVNIDEVLPAPAMDAQAVESEIRLAQSQHLLARVAERLRLDRDPEFGAAPPAPPGPGQALSALVRSLVGWAPGGGEARAIPPDRRAVAALSEKLEVLRQDESRVIAIRVESEDPDRAAVIANAVADQYILDQLEAKFDATERAARWLSDRLDEVAERLRRAEAAAEAQRARLAADHSGDLTGSRNRLAELGAALAMERSAEAEARDRDDPVGLLRAQRRKAALDASIADLEARITEQSRAAVALRQLEREAEALSALHQSVLTRLKETRALAGLERPDARLIAEAAAPLKPSSPNTRLTLAFALAAGLGLGATVAFLRESADGAHHTAASAERDAGLNVLAALPKAGGWRTDPVTVARKRPGSRLAESVRDLRQALLSTDEGEAHDRKSRDDGGENADGALVVAVVSPGSGEGKSACAALLAESCARLGRRTVLVDADIRAPSQANRYRLSGAADLLAVLEGEADLEEALWTDPDLGLSILPSEPAPPRQADLLAGPELRRLVEDLRARFEVVILDTPPLLAVADARLLAAAADRAALLLRWGETRREDLRAAARALEETGVAAAGLVLVGAPERAAPRTRPRGGRFGRFADYFED